jgi:hypothetical protein
MTGTAGTAVAIRPFHVDIPEEALEDLRRRIAATHWPEKETVPDDSQGVPLATMQKGVSHLLQRGRLGRALRRLGAARAVLRRTPQGVPVAEALTRTKERHYVRYS